MSKIKYDFQIPAPKEVEHGDITIEVAPFLGFGEQVFLITSFVKDYFCGKGNGFVAESEYDIITAEANLFANVLKMKTNVDMDAFSNDAHMDSILFAKIKKVIVNYSDFMHKLELVIKDVKETIALENSFGKVSAGIVASIEGFVKGLSDISPEQIDLARSAGMELLEAMEKSSVLGETPAKTIEPGKIV